MQALWCGDVKCRDQFVRTFGARAFRRTLRENEFKRYAAAFTAQASATGKFLEGARTVVEAMLQSPKFLFHMEAGPDGRSVDYDIASRLSYFLWDTMPDQALFDAAAKGELRTPAGREAATRRLLADPRAHQALDEFFDEWLRFDRVLNASKESRRFPEFSPEMAGNMVEETRRLLDHLAWDNGNFMELFTADYAYLSARSCLALQAPGAAGTIRNGAFPRGRPALGPVGRSGLPGGNAGPTETSPTHAGFSFANSCCASRCRRLLRMSIRSLPEANAERPLTRRQRMAEHVANQLCASCHRLMDPIGFGLESFDAIGRLRQRETILIESATGNRKDDKKIDLDLDTNGEIAGIPNSSFSDAKQLGAILAQSPVCQECIVRQIFRYAYGRHGNFSRRGHDPSTLCRFPRFRLSLQGCCWLRWCRSPEFTRGLEDNQMAIKPGSTTTCPRLDEEIAMLLSRRSFLEASA